MPLNKSIVEDAALTWFLLRPSYAKASAGKRGSGGQVGDPPSPHLRLRRTGLGYAVGHLPAPRSATWQAGGPQLAPGEPAAEPACAGHADRRVSFGKVATTSLVQTNRAFHRILRDPATAGLPKLLSGELSGAGCESKLEAVT